MTIRALVTGATGCVGANVVAALLARGYSVRAMRRDTSSLAALDDLDAELITGDVLSPSSLVAALDGCEWVFHCAAISDYWRSSSEHMYLVNVQGTRNVLEAALEAGVRRFVYTSSIGALGVPPPGGLLDESSTLNVPAHRFRYGHSKHLAEQSVHDAIAEGLDATIVNLALVMGARDIHLIGGSTLREVKRGVSWFSPPGGANWIDAETAGLGHVLAAERGRPGERYLLGGENLSHREVLTTVADIVKGTRPRIVLPRPFMGFFALVTDAINAITPGTPIISGEQMRLSGVDLYCNCQKAQQELGLPCVTFRAAAERAYAWYRAHDFM